jgi:hypothetical protein
MANVFDVPARLSHLTEAYDRQSKAHAFVQWGVSSAVALLQKTTPDYVFATRWPASRHHAILTKAAVGAGTVRDATWAGPLSPLVPYGEAYVEIIRPGTILGKLAGVRPVPFRCSVPTQTSGTIGTWVGEGKPIPAGSLAFATTVIDVAKIGYIAVITQELARWSDPSALVLVERDLRNGVIQATDQNVVDPAIASVPGLHPASLTNGAPSVASSGSTPAAVEADLNALLALVNNGVFIAPYLVMKSSTARYLTKLRGTDGQRTFPDITVQGQSAIWGVPIIASDSTGPQIVLIESSDVLVADSGAVVDATFEAALQMNTTPDDPSTATTVLVSLYQENLVGIRCLRYLNWAKARASSVAYISGVTY